MSRCYMGLVPRSDLDDLDQAATWTCGMNTAARRARIGGDERRNCARRAKQLRAKKIVGSTILGNAKSKIPNTWR
jgi:hypothetical protein